MKEFAISLRRCLTQGLRPKVRVGRLTEFLTKCDGLRPTPYGLSLHEPITNPFSGITVSWPNPRFFRGETSSILADRLKLYYVNESSWALTEMTPYSAYAPATPATIAGSDIWHFASIGASWFLTNGSELLYKTPYHANVLYDTDLNIKTLCTYANRIAFAGLAPTSWFAHAKWLELWDVWKKCQSEKFPTWDGMACNASAVIIGSAVGGDLDYPFTAELGLLGIPDAAGASTVFDKIKPVIMAALETGAMMIVPIPGQSEIRHLKQLGNHLIAYGNNNVYAIGPDTSISQVTPVGLGSRSNVAGDLSIHAFLDSRGSLWLIDHTLQAREVGCEEWLLSIAGNSLAMMNYDPQEHCFYMCKSNLGFLYDPAGGLGGLIELPTSLHRVNSMVGVLIGPKTGTGTTFEITTDLVDFGHRAVKFIQMVELGYSNLSSVQVQVESCFDSGSSLVATGWVNANAQGIAWATAAGVDFRIGVKGTLAAGAKMDYLTVKYKMVDRRTVRGIIVGGTQGAGAASA